MAKPFKEGNGWAFRLRASGQDIYQSGFKSEAAARKDMAQLLADINSEGKSVGEGPFRTCVAVAFSQYARERLPYLKGAPADSVRINRYLRALRLPVIQLKRIAEKGEGAKKFWEVHFIREDEQVIPNSLKEHRAKQAQASKGCDEVRHRLASMMVADVTKHEVQKFIDAMKTQGYKTNTTSLERSELRRLFNHARSKWAWTRPTSNPASDLYMPAPDTDHKTVLSNEQWQKMAPALYDAGNDYAPWLFCLMLETAMRSCEPLTYSKWKHVNWERNVLELPDAKSGSRDVPLSPGAIAVLQHLKNRAILKSKTMKSTERKEWSLEDKIFPTTYEAVKKAWTVARNQCGLEHIRMHDLRHTASTRYALQFKGDMAKVKVMTGHLTNEMVNHYTHISADHVAAELHGTTSPIEKGPAGYLIDIAKQLIEMVTKIEADRKALKEVPHLAPPIYSNVVRFNFSRRAA